MNSKYKVFSLSVLAVFSFSLAQAADNDANPALLGREKKLVPLNQIQVENLQGERLGSINDIAIDLKNGRIVEVLVRSGGFLGIGGDIVAVPPAAFKPDPVVSDIYRVDISKAAFKAAPTINTSMWNDADKTARVAAAYRYFGFEPYFLDKGEQPNPLAKRPEMPMGYIERSNKIVGMTVVNKSDVVLGKVDSIAFDVFTGRVLNVIVLAPGKLNERTVIPSMALRYNATHFGLVLDSTEAEFADEPRVLHTPAANGQPATSTEESYKGPRTTVPLEQGVTARDIDRSVLIKRNMRAAKVDSKHVDVATINGRVTLRGWVKTSAERDIIEKIAIDASRVEVVDNQLTVGKPAKN